MDVVGTGTDGSEAVKLYEELQPDILLMDIQMKPMNGLDAAEQILAKDKAARVLFLTTFSDDEYIVEALRIGAKGYCLKQDFAKNCSVIACGYERTECLWGEIVNKLPVLMQNKESLDYASYDISEKNRKSFTRWHWDAKNKEIAEALFLSEGLSATISAKILEKLSLRDRTRLAVFYYQHL